MLGLNLYTCRETLQRLDDYLDRELDPREVRIVERHLKICRQCARKFAFEADLVREIKVKLQRVRVPEELHGRVAAALAHASASSASSSPD